jgi:hypothetical protein
MTLFGGAVAPARLRPGVYSIRSLARSALALGLSILVFFPLFPAMPSGELDANWRMALNEAWARGLDFAHSMIFAYGPYAFLSTEQYQPATYPVLVVCSLFLGAVLFLLLRHIELRSEGRLHTFSILLCLVASEYTSSPDVRFLCLAFLLLVAAAGSTQGDARNESRSPLFSAPVVLNAGSFALGVICLVKATYVVETGTMGILGLIALYATGRRVLAPAVLVSFALGLTFFWLLAGQPLAELPRYFLAQAQVAGGYSEAMGGGARRLPLLLYLFAIIPLVIAVRRDLRPRTVGKYAVAIGMAVTLFICFKEGFIREDDWHVMIAVEALLIVPWCWPSDRADVWRRAQAATAGVLVLVFLLIFPQALDLRAKAADFEQLLHCSDGGPLVCPMQSGWLQKTYELSLARIRAHASLPRVLGTVDIYTVRQSLAIANGYLWDPRPVPQSYCAFTSALARMNAEHLLGATRPDAILFALEPIDQHLPALEDGPSWPILLSRYSVDWLGVTDGVPIAYLKHKSTPVRLAVARTLLLRATARLGQKVELPRSEDALFATMNIHPGVLGRLAELTFRVPNLYINFLFPGGQVERYRLVPGMARAGFVISPVVTTATQFAELQDLKVSEALSARRPTAFWLSGAGGSSLVWKNAATVEINALREVHN